ncbi:MAG: glucuronyl hydrolase [Mucilaginibacter sp.]|nr:glucuronyl hydrolase [Mucilaginibacter sp.]
MKLKSLLLIVLAVILYQHGIAQNTFNPQKALLTTIQKNLADADAQYKRMAGLLAPDQFPKAFHPKEGKMETSNSSWWCSGFYPGTLLKLYEQTHDKALLTEANRKLAVLAKEQYNTHTHDLGFMMYCSFGNANRLNPKSEYKQILLNSAKSLSTRFSPITGSIRSWDSKPTDFLVIIDNMMNLELLFWANKETGDPNYYKIAVTHANNTIKNHYRPDYSSYHVVNYDPKTGAVKEKKTAQGYSNESAWARGQVWGLYGFTVMYRQTQDKRYLNQANNIAKFILKHPHLPQDKIPYWDFNAPNIPRALRDASSGAIMASALLELCRYTSKTDGQFYFNTAQTILQSLSSPRYKSAPGTNGGFLLQHSVGNFPAGTEIDVPLTYADYYFVEAMTRYKAFATK